MLYNVNMLEPHIALKMVMKVVRLALKDQLDEALTSQLSTQFQEEGQDEKKKDDPPQGGEREMHWDGPTNKRSEPLPWSGMSRPHGLPQIGS